MYDAMTPELIDVIDNVKTLAEQSSSERRRLAEASQALRTIASDIAGQAVRLTDPLMRQSARTVADGLEAAAQLCATAIES